MQFNWPILGHKNIIEYLQTSIKNQKVAHAYLFQGPKNIGKTTVAKHFAASLLCQSSSKQVPCRQCIHCQQFFKNIHPDVYWIKIEEGKKNIGVEQIRDLEHKLSLGSFLNSYKIAVIEGAESLSLGASNSLLKTLEEPNPMVVIILLVSQIDVLPETIASRSQILKFLPVSQNETFDYLIEEGATREQAQYLSRLASGRPGAAMNLFQENQLFEDYKEKVDQFITMSRADVHEKLKIANQIVPTKMNLVDSGQILMGTLNIWSSVVRDLILIRNFLPDLVVNIFVQHTLKDLASRFDNSRLNKLGKEIEKTKKYLGQNVNPRLAVENLVLCF